MLVGDGTYATTRLILENSTTTERNGFARALSVQQSVTLRVMGVALGTAGTFEIGGLRERLEMGSSLYISVEGHRLRLAAWQPGASDVTCETRSRQTEC